MRRLSVTLLVFLLVIGVGSAGEAGSSVRDRSGGSIIFASDRSGIQGEVDAIDSHGTRTRQLVRDAYAAIWSPDGTRLAFLREVPTSGVPGQVIGLYVAGSDGRGARRLVTACLPVPGSVSWSPDSSAIAVLGESGCTGEPEIWRVDVVSGKVRRLRQAPTPPDSFDSVAWSPNGRQIAFVESPVGSGPGTLSVMNADGTGERLIGSGGVDTLSPPTWAPDGDRLLYGLAGNGCCSGAFRIVDVRTGSSRRLALPPGTSDPTWSPDGRWIAFGGVDGVQLIRPDGKGLRRLLPSSYASALAWSPDSTRIAIEGQGGTDAGPGAVTARGPVDVWVVPIDGRPAHRVTQGWRYGTSNDHPQWQPTGAPLSRIRGPYVSPAFASDSLQVGDLLETRHPVAWLAADGSRVALAYDPGPSAHASEVHSEVWDPMSRAITVLGDPGRCFSGSPCIRVAIAGDRVAELFIETGDPRFDLIGLLAGSLASPRMTGGTGPVCNGAVAQCLGVPIDDLLGSGSLVVFDTWTTPCRLSQSGCTGRPKTDGRLFRLDGTQAVEIASSAGALTPLSVDAGRILVDHEDGTIDIRTADGTLTRSFSFDAALGKSARLQGNDLVVQTPTAIEITDADTGVFERRWPLPAPDATLADLQDGIAVLVAGTDVHLLRLSDGQDAVLHAPGTGPVLAQLEPAGLYLAYTVADSAYPGRVDFIPHDQLPIR